MMSKRPKPRGASSRGKREGVYLQPNLPKIGAGRDDGRGTHYTPWLVIRYANGDDGTRSLPGGTVFWESPDVWAESTLGTNQPVPGQRDFRRVEHMEDGDVMPSRGERLG